MSAKAPGPTTNEGDDFVQAGAWGEIRHAKRANGSMEAKDWLQSATDGELSKFDHLFRRMAAFGKIHNDEHFRKLRDGIFEFKRDGNRILCFQHGLCWRLTHYYGKGGKRKCPPDQIEHAIQIRSEFLEVQMRKEKQK